MKAPVQRRNTPGTVTNDYTTFFDGDYLQIYWGDNIWYFRLFTVGSWEYFCAYWEKFDNQKARECRYIIDHFDEFVELYHQEKLKAQL